MLAQFVSHRGLANQISFTIDQDAKLFFALNNAMLDCSIATWEAKRFFDYVRPITAVHFLKAGQMIPTYGGTRGNPAMVLGENWKPFQPDSFITPPFPDYTSGHSCFSSAAAYILRTFTGSDRFGASVTVLTGSSKVQPGLVPATDITLSWTTYSAAAIQAGASRRLGGIHFQKADISSQLMGRQIGRVVWAKSLGFFTGHPQTTFF